MNLFVSIIVVLIILLLYSSSVSNCQRLIGGVYEADSTFCEESGLDAFCIYFDDDVDWAGNRGCYILAKKDDEVLINEPVLARISSASILNNWTSITNPKYYNINFKNLSEDCQEIFPARQCIRFYPDIGKMVLYYDDTISAVVYKNPIHTELKQLNSQSDE